MSKKKESSVFERYPKIAIGVISLVVISMLILVTELALRKFMGLGNPVLYSSYSLYGYRLAPNQEVSRFYGSVIKVNNLGLRASRNWDHGFRNKILFLGDSVTYGGSYISNEELFSSLATQNIPGYESGNAGVNAWGVENIHGLIVNSEFLPASVYVSVLPENDFYRGLTRLEGMWAWCRKPSFAFQELLYYFYYQQGHNRFVNWLEQADEKEKKRVVERAAMKIKEMDAFIKARGF